MICNPSSKAAVPVHDFISSAFNAVGVVMAVEQFLLAPLRYSFHNFKMSEAEVVW